jgi:hypothetical protein
MISIEVLQLALRGRKLRERMNGNQGFTPDLACRADVLLLVREAAIGKWDKSAGRG